MKVVIVFLLAVGLINASLPANLVKRSRPMLDQAIQKTKLQLTANVRSPMARDVTLYSVNEFLANLHAQALQMLEGIENALIEGQAIAQQYIQQLMAIIAEIQENGGSFVQGIISQLMQMFGSRSMQRNWLVDMLINAVLGSSSFQGLLNKDDTVKCLRNSGHNVNAAFIMNIIDTNGAYNFVTVTAAACIESSGGLERVVQTSPVVQFAWNTAGTFGMKGTVEKGIITHLGQELGSEIIRYLKNNPHARSFVSDLFGQIGSFIPDDLIETIQANLGSFIAHVQNYVEEFIATIIAQGQEVFQQLQSLLEAYPQIQAILPHIYDQIQNILGQITH